MTTSAEIPGPYLAVDPGRVAGWAHFSRGGILLACGSAKPPFTGIPALAPYVPVGPAMIRAAPWPLLVIEKPHGGRGKASRTDIAQLSRRMQMIIDLIRPIAVLEVAPNRWKRSVKKLTMTNRIRAEWMTDDDRAVLGHCRNHNVIDAVGLGIWFAASRRARTLVAPTAARLVLP